MYAAAIWAHAARSHINQIEASQSIILRQILNARWFMRNNDLRTAIKIPSRRAAKRGNHCKVASLDSDYEKKHKLDSVNEPALLYC
ncbi:hypothetical protein TNCV_2062971 [Trichonephila clavipes]|nr:hypothetical protein TNCV_2062971 [Trichonephila clavipes]